ncbi:glycosyltransferase [Candidatus Uabimicrobium sp. HlEnr_7]|uniref:glycosyltransferase n=1 Tax=Candidatus Uabimicrobium helgolandensis TaxID=3095367 RepID=UPI003557A3BE
MNIALMHFRAGETDGVSLEMDKWKKAMKHLGHECLIVSGCGGDYNHPYLDFRHSKVQNFFANAFSALNVTPSALEELAQEIYDKISIFLEETFRNISPQILIVNNVFSLPLNIPLAKCIVNLAQKYNIKIIGFHHDFYWEREIYDTTCSYIDNELQQYFPPCSLEKHLVINSIAQNSLEKQKKMSSIVVDNYFDFEKVTFEKDNYNVELRQKLNIGENDIFVLHATRIVRRKGIEFALQTCAAIQQKLVDENDPRKVHIVFPGLQEDTIYLEELKKYAEFYKIEPQFIPDLCTHTRESGTFSLWDFYVEADLVTYTSLYEGWGNQLIEAIAAKKPIILYEYPVFESNIKQLGFETFSLGNSYKEENHIRYIDKQIIDKVVIDILEFLRSPNVGMLERNYEIAKKHLSIGALEQVCEKLLKC